MKDHESLLGSIWQNIHNKKVYKFDNRRGSDTYVLRSVVDDELIAGPGIIWSDLARLWPPTVETPAPSQPSPSVKESSLMFQTGRVYVHYKDQNRPGLERLRLYDASGGLNSLIKADGISQRILAYHEVTPATHYVDLGKIVGVKLSKTTEEIKYFGE